MQERVVVLHREQAFRRKQVRGAVLPTVFVAVDGEELHRGVVRPALDDRRRGQDIVPRHPQSGKHAAGGIFGPSGPSVADFERVPLSRRGQQTHRSADQHRTFGRQLRRVERVVEPAGGVRVAGKPHERIVARRRGNRDFQRPPFAASLRIGEPCGGVAGNPRRTPSPRSQICPSIFSSMLRVFYVWGEWRSPDSSTCRAAVRRPLRWRCLRVYNAFR